MTQQDPKIIEYLITARIEAPDGESAIEIKKLLEFKLKSAIVCFKGYLGEVTDIKEAGKPQKNKKKQEPIQKNLQIKC